MQKKYPKYEMHFEKSRVFGWFWYSRVWGIVDEGSGWAPTYKMAQSSAVRYARKTIEHPEPIVLFFDKDGNPMDYTRGREA